jgi:hypothetical protein
MAEAVSEKLKVFISYSRRDSADFADELLVNLEDRGFAPFLDRQDIAAGEDWEARLGGLIGESDTVVFVVSPEAVRSERCVWEVDRTLSLSKRLLPVIYKTVPDTDVPEKLRRLQFIRFDIGPGSARPLRQLADALRQDLEWIREHTRLGELATRWRARGCPDASLLRGDELNAATEWEMRRKDGAPEVTEVQSAFIAASEKAAKDELVKERARLAEVAEAQAQIRAEQARTAAALTRTALVQRRTLWTLIGMSTAVLAGLGFGVWQYWSNLARQAELDIAQDALVKEQTESRRRQAQLDKGRVNLIAELVTGQRLQHHLDSALRFSVHAAQLEFRLQNRSAATTAVPATLAASVWQSNWRLMLHGHEHNEVLSAAFSVDGTRIITGSSDLTARVWDGATGKELTVLKGHERSVRFAAVARVWDVATWEPVAVLRGHRAEVKSAAFSADSARIVTASEDQTARVWDAATGNEIAVLGRYGGGVKAATFSRDGTRVLAAMWDGTAQVSDAATGNQIAVAGFSE